jgi:hypothetical protein
MFDGYRMTAFTDEEEDQTKAGKIGTPWYVEAALKNRGAIFDDGRDVLRARPGGPRHHGVLPASGQCRRRAIAHRNGRTVRRAWDRATS